MHSMVIFGADSKKDRYKQLFIPSPASKSFGVKLSPTSPISSLLPDIEL